MQRLSTAFVPFLAFLLVAAGVSAGQLWPLDREIDLSSGFGDFREGHFHAGIDLRTGGTIGAPVRSPVDGHVWRVVMSYVGYGKGLYVMGDDNHVYVFGHLSGFAESIDSAVVSEQFRSKRYYQDIYFPKDSIRIKRGRLIALSGKTGIGAPHLHFEKRTADNVPINPLTFGFNVKDRVAPEFQRVGFAMVDESSLLAEGRRQLLLKARRVKHQDRWVLDTVLYLNRPFGVLAEVFDRLRVGGMKLAVNRMTLHIDDDVRYECVFDSLDFGTRPSVALEYDYPLAASGDKHVRRLYEKPGNDFTRSGGIDRGVFGRSGNERIGLHHGRVVAEDCSGHKSELRFDFLWGPPGNLFSLDSVSTRPADSTLFFFSPIDEYDELGIDSILALHNVGYQWGPPANLWTTWDKETGRLQVVVVGTGVESAALKLFLFTRHGCVIEDNLFNGVQKSGKDHVMEIEYEVVEDGLLVLLTSDDNKISEARIELYDGGSLLGVEYPMCYDMTRYMCLVPPRPHYGHIDRIGATMSRNPEREVLVFRDSLSIHQAGRQVHQTIAVDDYFTMRFDRADFYEPRFVEVRHFTSVSSAQLQLNSQVYEIYPEAFVTRDKFDIGLRVTNLQRNHFVSGVCWLDKKADRWMWLNSELEGDVLKAKSQGGGTFAAVFDHFGPEIREVSLKSEAILTDPLPEIRFMVSDTLSGIADDQDIRVTIDGAWQLPEYDPESSVCQVRLAGPLSPGKHYLSIEVTDRADNKSEHHLGFYVRKGSGRPDGKQ